MSEIVTIVDRQNRVVGALPRAEMRARRLPHRASFVFVFRTDGRLIVQRRTLSKDVWPGYYDLAAGGVVVAGEGYKESALREVSEELGVSGVDLRGEIEFWFEDPSVQVWGMAYLCHFDGPLILQPEEVAAVEHWDRHELERARATGVRVTPDSWVAWDHLLSAGLIDSLI
ncbi:MAG: NUDIX domain-containing protein [Acidobacteria bacterium]|nr:NUDIX domain-containing protein [Acidobacteriota bacterium]